MIKAYIFCGCGSRPMMTAILATLTLSLVPASTSLAASGDELARRATWRIALATDVKDQAMDWLDSQQTDESVRAQIQQDWADAEQMGPEQALEQLLRTMARVDPRIAELYDLCKAPRAAHELPEVTVVQDESLPDWITSNLRLFFGCWLADRQLFNEASDQLSQIHPSDVADPATLLFYQSVVAHRRLDKATCLSTLRRLLENEDTIPERYAVVARLMKSDLAPLRPDSLNEISRMMDNITIRLGHGRAGKRVREEEEDVIAKLDKLIEQLEQQANAAGASGSASGSNAPSSPMNDSMPAGGTGPGNVDPKPLGAQTDWGNLPPKKREEALQQLSKDLPSHYRDVIEEYFRKLARDER